MKAIYPVLLVLSIAACSSEEPKTTNSVNTLTPSKSMQKPKLVKTKPIDVKINVSMGSHSDSVILKTNLPSGTTLLAHIYDHNSNALAEQKVTVEGGQIKLGPSENQWWEVTPGSYILELNSGSINGQPNNVQDTLGKDGKNLRGPHAKDLFSQTSIQFSQKIKLKGPGGEIVDNAAIDEKNKATLDKTAALLQEALDLWKQVKSMRYDEEFIEYGYSINRKGGKWEKKRAAASEAWKEHVENNSVDREVEFGYASIIYYMKSIGKDWWNNNGRDTSSSLDLSKDVDEFFKKYSSTYKLGL